MGSAIGTDVDSYDVMTGLAIVQGKNRLRVCYELRPVINTL